jgi:hypothetical protein
MPDLRCYGDSDRRSQDAHVLHDQHFGGRQPIRDPLQATPQRHHRTNNPARRNGSRGDDALDGSSRHQQFFLGQAVDMQPPLGSIAGAGERQRLEASNLH